MQVGDFEKALADYGRALQVDPHNSFAHYNRGITRDRLGDFTGAVEDFSAAIAIDASNADFYHNRGFSLRKQVCITSGSSIVVLIALTALLMLEVGSGIDRDLKAADLISHVKNMQNHVETICFEFGTSNKLSTK